jgi:hypothetical protein
MNLRAAALLPPPMAPVEKERTLTSCARLAAAASGVGLRRLHPDGPSIEEALLEAIG